MTHKHPDKHRYTILNVDDNEVGRYAVSRILQKEGFRVREASTGEEALRRAAERPDLIILDVHLPDMSGFEVCRKIKENPATSRIPILHLSATYTDAGSKAEGLESGADSYLTQPVEPMVLISTIRALLRMHGAERRTLAALKHWQTTFDAISDGVCLLDLDGRIRQCNQAMARLLDKSQSEIIGHRCRELLACDLPEAGGPCFDQIRKIGLRQSCELSFKDRCFQVTLDPVTGEAGQLDGVVQIITDITERKRVEQELQQYRIHLEELVDERTRELLEANERLQDEIRKHKKTLVALGESEEKYSTLVEQAKDGVVIAQDSVLQFVNRASLEISGYTPEELVGKPFLDLVVPEDKDFVAQTYARFITGHHDLPDAYEIKIRSRNGDIKNVEFSIGLIQYQRKPAVMAVVRDVTERKRMEEELRKMEKLESVGLLAGGIAHDFNNILTSVVGNLSLARLYVNPGEKAYRLLAETEKSAHLAGDLTRQLLTFAKGGSPVRKPASISEVLEDTAGFVLRGSNVGCQLSLPEDLWPVEIDVSRISQVINNLIVNARQAMPAGGIIRITAENMVLGPERDVPLDEGRYIRISVRDQGAGIPAGYIKRIFEPYFTTKQEGSGLGLATSFSIIRKHDGYLTVESEVGVGTTFFIYLPASLKEIEAEEEVEVAACAGQGRILFMDDEQFVRDVGKAMLEHLGYEVELATNGTEVIERYRQAKESGHPFELVIMDLTIPGEKGGLEAIKDLQDIDPEVKAIVSSGYSNDPVLSDFERYGFCGVVAKPYKIQELSQTLQRIIRCN